MKKGRHELRAAAKRLDDVELDRLWRLALQGEIRPALSKLSEGAPKIQEEIDGTPWRASSEWMFGRPSFKAQRKAKPSSNSKRKR